MVEVVGSYRRGGVRADEVVERTLPTGVQRLGATPTLGSAVMLGQQAGSTAAKADAQPAGEAVTDPLLIVASMGTEDRVGDVIDPDGWELSSYLRNPVFLWAHRRSDPPIGRSVRTWVEDGCLKALIEFAPTPEAQSVRALYAGGYMRGISVGFRPLKWSSRAASNGRRGTHFTRQELLEISAAPVPMHPDALARKNMDAQDLQDACIRKEVVFVTIEKYIDGPEAAVEPDVGPTQNVEAEGEKPMPIDTKGFEQLKSEVASVAQFVRERSQPLAEEQARVRKALDEVLANQRESQRRAITAQSGSHLRRVEDGSYAGFDVLDLTLARSLQRAAAASHGEDTTRDWDVRLKAALDSVTAGSGDELVPTGWTAQMWRDVRQETRVASLFNEIDMPTNPFDIPLQLGDVAWYPGTENTATTQTAVATQKQTLTAHELVAEVPWSLTLEEDAVIVMLPELRRTLVDSAASVLDDVLLNADTTSANNINVDGGAASKAAANQAQWRIGFDGLIHLPLVDNTAQAIDVDAALSSSTFLDLLSKLGKYGIDKGAAFVCDTSTYIKALGLDQVATVDKLGPKATLLNGQLGTIFGVPIVVAGQMRLADADGKITSGGNTNSRGRVLAVNRSQWRIGYRRRLLIETQRDIQKRQHTMVVSMRVGFAERTGTRSTATHTALAYNITL